MNGHTSSRAPVTTVPATDGARPARARRRDGTLAPFDQSRIDDAIRRAAREAAEPVDVDAVGAQVTRELIARAGRRAPEVEEIQDAVETALMASGHVATARAFVVYRRQHAELRAAKAMLGVRDELKLSVGAAFVLRERCLLRDDRGRVTESTAEMMRRVARHVAGAERAADVPAWEERFAGLLERLEFLPNSPTLMNAATPVGFLSGCVVLPLDDSLRAIFDSLGDAAAIHQTGAGTGFSFSDIRPAGDRVASTGGHATGPVSFLHVFDVAAGVVRSGGRRRAANMAVLDVSHPDIVEFVRAKSGGDPLDTFNLSVAVPDSFLTAVVDGRTHRLVNPRTGRTVARVDARRLFDQICDAAWRCGDPGLLFLDRINRANPVPSRGRIRATNPCGEVPLLPNESCNLGSVNLTKFAGPDGVDWRALTECVRTAVRFLDDVIDVNRYPVPALEAATVATRKIGLGVMGLADLLAGMGVPYGSDEAVRIATRIARHVTREARRASAELAEQRGAFPLFSESVFARRGAPPLRNAQVTAMAPTGTISLIAGTTSGIEPLFAVAFVRDVLGRRLLELNPTFERLARDRGFFSEQLAVDIAAHGTLAGTTGVPADVRRAFITALELSPEQHLRMQAAVQREIDGAASKTVNLPESATVDDVRRLYLAAWRSKVKGITAYRYGSRPDQVLTLPGVGPVEEATPVAVDLHYTGGCAAHACDY